MSHKQFLTQNFAVVELDLNHRETTANSVIQEVGGVLAHTFPAVRPQRRLSKP